MSAAPRTRGGYKVRPLCTGFEIRRGCRVLYRAPVWRDMVAFVLVGRRLLGASTSLTETASP